jgi:carbon storage regulator
MLVLSRMVGERLIIADQIVVTVTQVDRGRVRLGIEAPPDVRVLRAELDTQPHRAKASAAKFVAAST